MSGQNHQHSPICGDTDASVSAQYSAWGKTDNENGQARHADEPHVMACATSRASNTEFCAPAPPPPGRPARLGRSECPHAPRGQQPPSEPGRVPSRRARRLPGASSATFNQCSQDTDESWDVERGAGRGTFVDVVDLRRRQGRRVGEMARVRTECRARLLSRFAGSGTGGTRGDDAVTLLRTSPVPDAGPSASASEMKDGAGACAARAGGGTGWGKIQASELSDRLAARI